MQSFALEEGRRILVREDREAPPRRFRLLNEVTLDGEPHWQLVPVASSPGATTGAVISHMSTRHLLDGFGDELVEFDDERDDDTPGERDLRRRRRERLVSEKSPEKQKYIKFWCELIREVDRKLPAGLKTAKVYENGVKTKRLVLEDALVELGTKIGEKHYGRPRPVSVSQYYRVRSKRLMGGDDRDVEPNTSARGRRNQLLPEVKRILRDTIAEKLENARHKPRKGDRPTTSVKDMAATVLERLEELKKARPDLADRIKLPGKTTFYDTVGQAPARLRVLAVRKGVSTARDFRRPWGHEPPEHALSQVQYDETLLPLFCFCDVLRIPLGRPHLSWLVDVFSNAILGIYLGFEPPGDAVFSSVFRHATLPKSYVARAYPDIGTPWLMSGLPRFVTFDNSQSGHGNTIERLLGDLDIPYDFTLARMPWLKGVVENAFHILNVALLRDLPGFVLSEEVDRTDYDPQENGCIGFLHLLWIVHRFLLEVLHPNPPTVGGPSPNARWLDGTRIVKPRYPRTGQDLDFIFGIVREGVTLDHRGVVYEGIRYYSEGADGIRYWNGANLKVTLKVNPINLSCVLARYGDQAWVRCHALNAAEGQSTLHLHKLRQRNSERLFGKADWESRIRAEAHMRKMMRGAVLEDHGARVSSLLARSLGIGTHVVFDRMGGMSQAPFLSGFTTIGQGAVEIPAPRTRIGQSRPTRALAPPEAPATEVPAVPATEVPVRGGPSRTPATKAPTIAAFGVRTLPRRQR